MCIMRRSALVLCSIVLLLAVLLGQSQAKNYTRCGLITELLDKGFSRSLVGNWVCLIESESGKDTSKKLFKASGNEGMGLFQIKSKDWCTFGSPGGRCNIKCEDLIDDDISDDSVCARKVEGQLGFRAWDGWTRSCCGRSYPLRIAKTCLPRLPTQSIFACPIL